MRRAFVIALALTACGEEAPPIEPEPAQEPSTGAARWESVRRPTDAALLEHPAQIVADPRATGQVSAPFRARVTRIDARAGQRVEEGDPIVSVVMPEVLDAAAALQATGARIAAHRAREEQLARLREEGIVDASRVFEQRATIAELEAERARALAVLRSASLGPSDAGRVLRQGSVVLRAPTAGIVRSLDARLGELREPGGEPLATIVGAGDARVEVRSAERLPDFAAATFDAADGTSVSLRAEPLARVTDPQEGTYVTWLEPRAPVDLPDGLRGTVRLELRARDLWEVPSSSLVAGEAGAEVLRQRGDGFERVRVDVVASSGATSIVRGPLSERDSVAAQPSALESEAG